MRTVFQTHLPSPFPLDEVLGKDRLAKKLGKPVAAADELFGKGSRVEFDFFDESSNGISFRRR